MRSKVLSSLIAGGVLSAALAFGQGGIGPIFTGVAKAKKDSGHPGTAVAPGYSKKKVVVGSDVLENPSGSIITFGRLRPRNGISDTSGRRFLFSSPDEESSAEELC